MWLAQSPLSGCIPAAGCDRGNAAGVPTELCGRAMVENRQLELAQRTAQEHGLSFLAMKLETNGRAFVYESRDLLASRIIFQRNGNCPASAFPLEKLLFANTVIPMSIQQVMALHQQANSTHEIKESCC